MPQAKSMSVAISNPSGKRGHQSNLGPVLCICPAVVQHPDDSDGGLTIVAQKWLHVATC